ncbi:hypothetical protein Vafri_5211, partial [Volvox africanus]
MLTKGLRKFKDRIFSASRKEDSFSGTDYSEGPESPSVNSPRKFSSIKSKNSSYGERTYPELVASSSMRSNASTGHGHIVTLKESPILTDHNQSPNGAAVLPPVQISSSQNSFTAKSPQAPNLAAMFNPSSGRRRSTPAALDMALRSAEGKVTMEQLLQPGQNKLVFGNYFAGTSAAARDQAAAVAAAERQRAKAAGAASAAPVGPHTGLRPPPIQPSGATIPAYKAPPMQPISLHSNDPGMATVLEDVAMDDVEPQQAAPSISRKHAADNVSDTSSGPQSPTGGGAHKVHLAPHPPQTMPLLHPPQLGYPPQHPPQTPHGSALLHLQQQQPSTAAPTVPQQIP